MVEVYDRTEIEEQFEACVLNMLKRLGVNNIKKEKHYLVDTYSDVRFNDSHELLGYLGIDIDEIIEPRDIIHLVNLYNESAKFSELMHVLQDRTQLELELALSILDNMADIDKVDAFYTFLDVRRRVKENG